MAATLNGSEKQISWASDIREKMLGELDELLADIKEDAEEFGLTPGDEEEIEKIEKTKKIVEHIESAEWLINARNRTAGENLYLLHGMIDNVQSGRKVPEGQADIVAAVRSAGLA